MKPAGALLKAVIQKIQTPATTYFNALSDLTLPQIKKAQRLQDAFQQVSMTLQPRKRSNIQL